MPDCGLFQLVSEFTASTMLVNRVQPSHTSWHPGGRTFAPCSPTAHLLCDTLLVQGHLLWLPELEIRRTASEICLPGTVPSTGSGGNMLLWLWLDNMPSVRGRSLVTRQTKQSFHVTAAASTSVS